MLPLRRARLRRSRTKPLVAILLLTAALAAFLAYEAWDAARSHQAAAERTVRDYANFAAWEFSASLKEQIHTTLAWVFSPTAKIDVRGRHDTLPEPCILASGKTAKLQCARDSSRYYFRLDLRDRSLVTSGDTPSAAMRAWVLDTVPRHSWAEYGRDWDFAAIFGTIAGEPRAVAYQLVRDARGTPVAAYGFELCLAQFAAPGFDKVRHHYTILPPSLTGRVPNDSLFSVRVADLHGHELFRSPVQYPPRFAGEHRLEAFGGLATWVTLRPDMAPRLIIGGVPRSRVPVLLGVLALTMGLAAIGVLQLRREDELARMRANFIAGVSHELRTPLAQVRMFAETLLLGRVRSEGERRRSLEIIDQEARRLTHLVENILQFSRAERRAIHLAPVPVELASQLREAVEAFSPVARARRTAVRTALEDGVIAAVDPGALRQIVLNLLDNAAKYGPPEQTVTVGLRRDGERARVWLDDEGPGIPPRDRARVWEAFHRLERDANSAVAGSGIGLAVVHELVTLHGGRVRVEDAPGRGARFVVELPAERDSGGGPPQAGGWSRDSQELRREELATGPAHSNPDSRIPNPTS